MNDEVEMNDLEPSELDTLKARADLMGIKYHPNVGLDKLKAKIDNALSATETKSTVPQIGTNQGLITHEQYMQEKITARKKKANSLVRINVTCMNPNKKEWEGEIISVGSSKLGTFKRYVPFNTTDGWHVEHIIYEAMKDRKCSVFHTVKDHLGQKVRKAKQVNEFAIQVLPPLTDKERKDLAQRQAMANGTSEG